MVLDQPQDERPSPGNLLRVIRRVLAGDVGLVEEQQLLEQPRDPPDCVATALRVLLPAPTSSRERPSGRLGVARPLSAVQRAGVFAPQLAGQAVAGSERHATAAVTAITQPATTSDFRACDIDVVCWPRRIRSIRWLSRPRPSTLTPAQTIRPPACREACHRQQHLGVLTRVRDRSDTDFIACLFRGIRQRSLQPPRQRVEPERRRS